jgi:hypothetical protein
LIPDRKWVREGREREIEEGKKKRRRRKVRKEEEEK